MAHVDSGNDVRDFVSFIIVVDLFGRDGSRTESRTVSPRRLRDQNDHMSVACLAQIILVGFFNPARWKDLALNMGRQFSQKGYFCNEIM